MESSYGGGLISFEFDKDLLRQVEKTLGNLKGESRKCLKNAVNKTAKQAKKDLAKKAQETYVVKSTRMTKAMKTDHATTGNLTAVINVTGEPMPLSDFKVSPAKANPPEGLKAKVLQASGMKPLVAGTKAFHIQVKNMKWQKVKGKNGKYKKNKDGKYVKEAVIDKNTGQQKYTVHKMVVQRRGKNRYPLRVLYSNSVPKMIGNYERVYGVIEPHIRENLMNNLVAEIKKVVSKA